ncbi:hypothetical protein BU24DRAFT_459458 [Aaosphaeria arxii CBS 175.79]|uniref:Uncharacterized protein n=1 Tax=Aaosphaeria arxii CBS 175.79 TaxID=1450172 RepID=A0A6A5Y3H0_9PLEO|nr:uncharacterized protein BU24DRAFT_459458 [Aaosphaeria arxii CBS 175.79]KAF2019829.1 hypothetical protein BU24DRAFT_459458 [Aaosphaeria arxii CBS 175.79]
MVRDTTANAGFVYSLQDKNVAAAPEQTFTEITSLENNQELDLAGNPSTYEGVDGDDGDEVEEVLRLPSFDVDTINELDFLFQVSEIPIDQGFLQQDQESGLTIYDARPLSIDPMSTLGPLERSLLNHYINQAVRITSTSAYTADEICRFIIPRCMEAPSLLYATMAWSAVHLRAVGGLMDKPNDLVLDLQLRSIRHLQSELEGLTPSSHSVTLATTRTLCQTQIFAGEHKWRTHLTGAKAVMEAVIGRVQRASSSSITSNSMPRITSKDKEAVADAGDFLNSWYDNIEALSSLMPTGSSRHQLEYTDQTPTITSFTAFANADSIFFDHFGGLASDIPALLRHVAIMVRERRQLASSQSGYIEPSRLEVLDHFPYEATNTSFASEIDLFTAVDQLEMAIIHRLASPMPSRLSNGTVLSDVFSESEMRDYENSNRAFLHTALLHLRCSVRQFPICSYEVQSCVDAIVECADGMTPTTWKGGDGGLSPRVLFLTPLFTAGCRAVGQEMRDRVRAALSDIQKWMRTPHTDQAVGLLEAVWANGDDISEEMILETLEQYGPDFMPY